MLGVVTRITGYNSTTGAAVVLQASSHDDPAVCHLDGGPWLPTFSKLPSFRYDLFDGAFAGQITAPATSFSLSTEVWADFSRYSLADARVQFWTGEVGAPWSQWTERFSGRTTEQPEQQDLTATLSIAVDDRWLDTALLATYAGTTGAEGPAALKGQVKPLALGAPRYVPGVLIDSVNNVLQLSGYGAVQGIDTALERLARFGAPVADYPTYAALVAATLRPGTWATANAVGMARFGAPVEGQISFLMRGDIAGPNGWARKPGQLIRRLALLSGGAGKIDDASLDALDAARPYNLSLYIDQQTTAREVIQQIAASVNAVAFVSWTGKLTVIPVGITTPTVTLAADGSALPPVSSVQQLGVAAPWRKLAIGAERAWTVHALSDIAFSATLTPMGDYVATTTYREGNIVQFAGGTYLYKNPVPASGNAPTDTTYWSVAAAPGKDGTGNDGVPGTSNATIPIYQRSATGAPALPSATVTYTYATAGISGLNNGWTAFVIPAGTDPLYASAAVASSTSGTDTIAANEWAAAREILRNGAKGEAAPNSVPLFIYQRAATAPALPSANATYTFSTRTLAGLNNGWSATIPALNPSAPLPLFVSTVAALSPTDVDNINPSEWAAAQVFAQNGADGKSAFGANLTNEEHTVPADVAGNVTSYAGAETYLNIYEGSTMVGDGAWTYSVAANPQNLIVYNSGRYFRIDGGLDANEEVATLTLLAVGNAGGPYANAFFDKVFTLSKARAPASGVSPSLISVEATSQQVVYNGADQQVTGDINIYTTRVGSNQTPYYTLTSFDGTVHGTPNFTAQQLKDTYGGTTFDTAGIDNLVLRAGWLGIIMQQYGGGLRVKAMIDGRSDTVSIAKVKDGATGAAGANSFTLANVANTTVVQNVVTKTSGEPGWNGKARTIEGGPNPIIAGKLDRGTFIGLATNPAANVSFDSVNYNLHRSTDSNFGIAVYRNGSSVFNSPEVNNQYENVLLSVRPELGLIRYYAGDTLLYSHSPDAAVQTLYGAFSLSTIGNRVRDIAYSQGGKDGADAYQLTVATPALIVKADANNATKGGQFPRTIEATVKKGLGDVTGGVAFTLTPSNGSIACSITQDGNVTITAADAEGNIAIGGTYQGVTLTPARIEITRQRDAAPAGTSQVQSASFSKYVSSTSYIADGYSPIVTINTPNGQLKASIGGDFVTDVPNQNANANCNLAARLYYRVAGSGAAWSDMGTEQTGSISTYRPGEGLEPGSVSCSRTISVAAGNYEIMGALRKSVGTAPGAIIQANIIGGQ